MIELRLNTILYLTASLIAAFLLSACSVSGDDDREPVHQFTYQVFDEQGEMISTVSDETSGETEIETSLGLFGDSFFPDWIAEDLGLDPSILQRNQIYLHAENGVTEDVRFATLNFAFQRLSDWDIDSYEVFGVTEENWIEVLRRIWEERRDRLSGNLSDEAGAESLDDDRWFSRKVNANYNDFGIGTKNLNFMYVTTGGEIEITSVSDDRIEGSFTIDISGLPGSIMSADSFPDELNMNRYTITGSFAAVPGDFEDLLEARTDIFNQMFR